MKIGALFGAALLFSACSMTLVPQGVSAQQDSVWTTRAPSGSARTPTMIGEDTTRALGTGIAAGPDVAALNLSPSKAGSALQSYRTSCGSLVRREDNSGLTNGADWQASCQAAQSWPTNDATRFSNPISKPSRLAMAKPSPLAILNHRFVGRGFEIAIIRSPSIADRPI